jgi:hypothetical protein
MPSRRSDANHPLRPFAKTISSRPGTASCVSTGYEPRSQRHVAVIATDAVPCPFGPQALRRAANQRTALSPTCGIPVAQCCANPEGRVAHATQWFGWADTQRWPRTSALLARRPRKWSQKSDLSVSCVHRSCTTVNRPLQSWRDAQCRIGVRQEFSTCSLTRCPSRSSTTSSTNALAIA